MPDLDSVEAPQKFFQIQRKDFQFTLYMMRAIPKGSNDPRTKFTEELTAYFTDALGLQVGESKRIEKEEGDLRTKQISLTGTTCDGREIELLIATILTDKTSCWAVMNGQRNEPEARFAFGTTLSEFHTGDTPWFTLFDTRAFSPKAHPSDQPRSLVETHPASPDTTPSSSPSQGLSRTSASANSEPIAERGLELSGQLTNALVIIRGSEGSGSGFLCTTPEGPFLFTNSHVIAAISDPTFRKLNGEKIVPTKLEEVPDRDIFRMRCDVNGGGPLQVVNSVDTEVHIGDRVLVLGNSDGAGVAKALEGNVIGIGPDLIEVDAPFVPGNSGSPIIHERTGKVVGIATYILVKKVQYGREVTTTERRFGYRMDNAGRWEGVNWNTFRAQASQFQKIEQRSTAFTELFSSAKDGKLGAAKYSDAGIQRAVEAFIIKLSRPGMRSNLSPADLQDTRRQFYADLRNLAHADVNVFAATPLYGYFRKALGTELQFRDDIYTGFTQMIDQTR